jgi:hypothetical protein
VDRSGASLSIARNREIDPVGQSIDALPCHCL